MIATIKHGVAFLLLVLSVGLAPGVGAADVGEAGPGAPGVQITPRTLPVVKAPGPPREVPEPRPVDEATFKRLKEEANDAARRVAPGGAVTPTPAPAGRTVIAPTFSTISSTGWNPPDGGLAVGPTRVLVAVNESFAVYSRTGTLQGGPWGLATFFAPVTGSIGVFDPRAMYDKARGRFVLLGVTFDATAQTAFYKLAVSKTNDPLGIWCKYSLNAVTATGGIKEWADYPGLGMDGDRLYITSNQFTFGFQFKQARVVVVPKTKVYSATATSACPTATSSAIGNLKNPGGALAFTIQPAHQPDALPLQAGQYSEMYLVNAIYPSGSQLAVRKFTTTSTTANLASPAWVNVPCYTMPADAPQPGGGLIETGDTRLGNAVQRFGTIYTSNTTRTTGAGCTARTTDNAYANAQWYELAPGQANAFVVSDPNTAFFFPSVMPGCTDPACAGVLVGFQVSGSGPAQPASAFFGNTMCGPVVGNVYSAGVYAAGVAGYTQSGRWGDYSAAAADPNAVNSMAVFGEYAQTTGGWGTAVIFWTIITNPSPC